MNANGFLKAHRLSLKKDIEAVFSEGNSFTEFPFRFIWSVSKSDEFSIKVAISVPKKRFIHAVDRNLIRRRIREAFRKAYNEQVLDEKKQVTVQLVIVYVDSTFRLQPETDEKISVGIKKILRDV